MLGLFFPSLKSEASIGEREPTEVLQQNPLQSQAREWRERTLHNPCPSQAVEIRQALGSGNLITVVTGESPKPPS